MINNILHEDEFNRLFPKRNSMYTYESLLDAIEYINSITIEYDNGVIVWSDGVNIKKSIVDKCIPFPKQVYNFLNNGSDELDKLELSSFLANISHETSYYGYMDSMCDGGLYWIEEINKSAYIDFGCSNFYPKIGNMYYGRGPIQLSWNYNYGLISLIMFGDKDILLETPNIIITDSKYLWLSSIAFWMNNLSPFDLSTIQSCHDVYVSGFYSTIKIINGVIENTTDDLRVISRLKYYNHYCREFNIDPVL